VLARLLACVRTFLQCLCLYLRTFLQCLLSLSAHAHLSLGELDPVLQQHQIGIAAPAVEQRYVPRRKVSTDYLHLRAYMGEKKGGKGVVRGGGGADLF